MPTKILVACLITEYQLLSELSLAQIGSAWYLAELVEIIVGV